MKNKPRLSLAVALALSALGMGLEPAVAFATPAAPPAAGPPIELASAPEASVASAPACSQRLPLCVRAPAGTRAATILATVAAAERAWDVVTGALGLPPPDAGLDPPWHVYLADDVPGGGSARSAGRDPLARFDRASSFALVDRTVPVGCALDRVLAAVVARASLWRAAPATDEGTARAETQSIVDLAVPCTIGGEDFRRFQSEPERTLIDPAVPSFDRGAAAFFGWLDETLASQPGGLIAGLWSLAPTRTPPGAWRWSGAPTGFDVLRMSLKDALWPDSTLDDAFVRFAVERALAQPPAQLAWHIPWPAKARRFASPRAVSPTGASYVMLDHAGAPAGAKLRVELQWEDYGRMRWVVVKLDAAGGVMAEVAVNSLDRVPHVAMTIEALDDVDRVLVIGVNVGSTENPFDPEQGEWEPHGWLLTVDGE